MFKKATLLTAGLSLALAAGSADALVSQYGVLDLAANGGINPNTGAAWQVGDQYRLAFYTAGTISGESDDPAVYDAFATTQAQQNPALAASTGWTAMVWVNTDASLPQAVDFNAIGAGESPLSSPLVRGGYGDTTDGAGIGGAGVPVYAMNGTTAIARNNADILNNWSNPFDSDATLRLAAGSFNLDSDGNSVEASQGVHYSPYLDQFGLGDSANIHGTNVWTGGFANPVNPLGNSVDPDTQVRGSWGSSNANNAGRTWNRFQGGSASELSVYAISELLTIMDDVSALPGDTDGDGDVDDSDLGTSFANYTGPVGAAGGKTAAEGDTDGDGDVDDSDLGTSFAEYTGPIAVTAVPEPTSLALLGLGGLLIARRRRA